MKIPTVSPGQFVLIIADFRTGHILNRDKSLYASEGENYYTVYDNREAVMERSQDIVRNDNNIEAIIYNDNGQFEYMVRPSDFPTQS